MILMDLFRVLDQEQEIEILQDDNDGGVVFFKCKPNNIPVNLLEASIEKVSHGEDLTVVELCS